uniref:Rho guanine nucleotide exchange factor 11-like n=1 Tax=Salmo trutta TaxID=8032 RepID=A0A673ZNK2_SALTR
MLNGPKIKRLGATSPYSVSRSSCPAYPSRLSSLTIGDSERNTSSGQQREPLADIPPENTGLVQRCVVVQKDQLGFGFTVCGERIKLVQNVRPGGAAVKAGVHEGDRIIKVNGSLVSSMSHQEVVKLIKSGPYVALTLQGPPPSAAALVLQPLPADLLPNQRTSLGGEAPPPPPPPLPPGLTSTPSQRINKPLQVNVQKHATQILRNMLEQGEAELQDLMEELSRNPSPSLEERIESAKRRTQQVRVKIKQDLVRCLWSVSPLHPLLPQTCESPHSSPSFFRTPLRWRQGSDTHTFSDSAGKTQIIGPEEEEEEDDSYALNEMDGPFQDIELLKSRPAHMTVFMRYVFSQLLDPNPLLFYLSVEAYLGSSPKDARALAPQICSHFLDPDAPLKIRVREEYLTDIESRLHAQEDIRGPLSELQQQVLPDIQDQIQDYRNKQMMGLGSLFGEGDLQQLDGDPAKEKQVVDRQVTALWEILSKHEDDRSSPLASAVLLYLRHSGIKLRDSRVFPGLSTEKEKWLAFFPKTKKLSSAKKEKDGEDRKRNPILKYIGKPRSTSQSTFHVPLSPTEVRPGSVRNIIQQFENHPEIPGEEGAEGDLQRLSSSSLGEDSMDSPMVSVRLARSESLKAQGEGRRRGGASGVETVPRSRSDVDIEDCGEEIDGPGLRPLHHSAASSATSSSARSLENPTPPYTPRSFEESPVALLPDAPALEDDVVDSHNWQETVAPQVLATLCPREVDRQAVIYELLTTEASHLRTLRVLDQVFFQKMRCVLSSDELACIFPNLPQVYQLHVSLCEAMKKKRESPIVRGIGDIMLARFEGVAGEEFQEQASHLCSQQSQALELIKNKQRKDLRFTHIIQECEASPHCRRLQLKDLLVSETQRLTKYPLLLDNIIKHTEAGSTDLPPLQRAQACCRGILQAVNEVVRETEHRQRLHQYQRRLDPTPQFKYLPPLQINKDKTLEIQALLLSDLLVLLQRGPDDRLLLRCPSRWLGGGGGGSGDTKASFSPVVQLDSLLVRSVATDNKALYVISTTERKIYELVAGTSSEKNIWKDQLEKTISLVADDSMTEQVVFMETDSPNDEDNELAPTTPTDQSGAFLCGEGRDYVKRRIGLAEAALEDVETLRQLIFRDLEEDGWSHGSDGTPTNEAVNERSPFNDQQRPPSSETLLSVSPSQWEAEHAEAPPSEVESPSVHVVRKAVVAGSPSIPDDITEDVTLHSDQSPEPRGNVFYLVMPTGQGEGLLDESHTDEVNDPPTPTTTELPDLEQEVMSSPVQTHEKEGQVASIMSADNQSERENLSWEEGRSRSQKSLQSHVIKNVDDIFHTIEELMRKLHQLRDIETAHHQLLKTLRDPPVNPESGDLFRIQATVVRTPFLDRDPGDGEFRG